MKKILVGMSTLVATLALAACSGGGSTPVAVGNAAATTSATTSTPAPVTTTSSSAPTSTTPPAPSTSTSKPAPKTTTKPNAATPAKPAADPGVPCTNVTTGACVDLSAHKAWLLQGGQVIYGPVPMLPGRKGYPTPVGTFHVYSREKMHLSKEFDNAKMPNSVFFYPGDAFHTGSLSVYSHGCIHLSSSASLKFFDTLRIGDTVQVVP
nr:L,D-transpeptidase [Amycolatopsis sp.]